MRGVGPPTGGGGEGLGGHIANVFALMGKCNRSPPASDPRPSLSPAQHRGTEGVSPAPACCFPWPVTERSAPAGSVPPFMRVCVCVLMRVWPLPPPLSSLHSGARAGSVLRRAPVHLQLSNCHTKGAAAQANSVRAATVTRTHDPTTERGLCGKRRTASPGPQPASPWPRRHQGVGTGARGGASLSVRADQRWSRPLAAALPVAGPSTRAR